jgi:hypothetical protein
LTDLVLHVVFTALRLPDDAPALSGILDRRPQHADLRKAQMEVVIVLQRRALFDEGRPQPGFEFGRRDEGRRVEVLRGSSMVAGGIGER